jgi:hypothetical protein
MTDWGLNRSAGHMISDNWSTVNRCGWGALTVQRTDQSAGSLTANRLENWPISRHAHCCWLPLKMIRNQGSPSSLKGLHICQVHEQCVKISLSLETLNATCLTTDYSLMQRTSPNCNSGPLFGAVNWLAGLLRVAWTGYNVLLDNNALRNKLVGLKWSSDHVFFE